MATNLIVGLSQLEGQKRIDPEYYQPKYLEIRHKLSKIETKKLKNLSTSVVSFGAYSLCNYIVWREEGIPYLNVENIKDGYIDTEGIKYIDEDVNEILEKSQVKEGQVILTMAGTIGNAAVAYKLPAKINSNQATAKITLKPNISPFFVAAFLNSYFGKKQTEWEIVTSVQPNIFLWQIKNIKVPTAYNALEEKVEEIYKKALNKLELCKTFYAQAENILFEKLELIDFKIKYELSYTTNLSNIFGAHRLDAEYSQPIHEKLLVKLRKSNHMPFRNFIKNHGCGYAFRSENYQNDGIPLIRINNIKKSFLDLSDTVYLNQKDFEIAYNDVAIPGDIVLGMSGTIGISAIVPENIPKCSINQRILHFTPTNIEPLYLLNVLNSFIGSLQMNRIGTGGVQTNIRYRDIRNIIIPILPSKIQQKIALLVHQSHEARKEAKELLRISKMAVEIAVEKNEKEANNFISNSEMNKY